MTRVHILSAYPESSSNRVAAAFRSSAERCSNPNFRLVSEPDDADLVIFAESHPVDDPLFFCVGLHPVRKRLHARCFIYTDTDYAFPVMRGLYPSLSKRHLTAPRFRGAAYYGQSEANPFIEPAPDSSVPSRLASF